MHSPPSCWPYSPRVAAPRHGRPSPARPSRRPRRGTTLQWRQGPPTHPSPHGSPCAKYGLSFNTLAPITSDYGTPRGPPRTAVERELRSLISRFCGRFSVSQTSQSVHQTWTVLLKGGRNHLCVWSIGLSFNTMARITSDCGATRSLRRFRPGSNSPGSRARKHGGPSDSIFACGRLLLSSALCSLLPPLSSLAPPPTSLGAGGHCCPLPSVLCSLLCPPSFFHLPSSLHPPLHALFPARAE